ncbi:hypothetical protein CGLO_08672 [Colletotrichum gloeosporioides Cg-14]|uniref:6-phosphogluconate dehydrogenase NADP-binding domain-containing protein n=1 Tax=Colletotrichum gloeosporioides (strain Cg-14) TaxID=1237896 RepID=T0LJE6_COLGC|nr:hypothetical protein CGLO_08672 [Colletotrichum gloeosporioides Cg-14]
MSSSQISIAPRLGWIGLGSMGLHMASNLQKYLSKKQGPSLRFYNRTESRGDPLKQLGGTPSTIPDLVSNSDIVFMSLADDLAVESVLDKILEVGQLSNKIIVDTSTIQPSSSAAAKSRLQEKGADYVAAPVVGASPIAAKAQLLWILAGKESSIEAVRPLITGVMGKGIVLTGDDVRQASYLKAVANTLSMGMVEVVGVAHTLGEKAGLGIGTVEALLKEQMSPVGLMVSNRLTSGAYMPPRGERPWSPATNGVAAGRQALKSGTQPKLLSLILQQLEEAVEYADAADRQVDASAIYGVIRKNAGLSFETDQVKKRDGAM